jgi:hypothetical protein
MDYGHTSLWSEVVGATDFYPATPWEVAIVKQRAAMRTAKQWLTP